MNSISKIIYMFVVHNVLKGGETRQLLSGYFYIRITAFICGFVPPCGTVIEPQPLRRYATGKARPFLFCLQQIIISEMHNTEKNCLNGQSISTSNTSADETRIAISSLADMATYFPNIHKLQLRFYKNYITGFINLDGRQTTFRVNNMLELLEFVTMKHAEYKAYVKQCRHEAKMRYWERRRIREHGIDV